MSLIEEQELAESLADRPLDPEAVAAANRRAFLDLPVGLHENIPDSVYHARIIGVASSGALTRVLRSPAHYRAWIDGYERAPTPELSLGKAIHMAILEPEVFARTYVIEPPFGDIRKTDRTTKDQAKENKTRRDAWRLEHAGATVLDAKSAQTTLGMVNRIARHPRASRLLADGIPEATVKWVDQETGLVCRLRVDFLLQDIGTAVDLKSTGDARAEAFSGAIDDYGFHRQEAHYLDGLGAIGLAIEDFVFLPIEKEPPYEMSFFQLEDEDRATGQKQVRAARRRLATCLERDEWSGYPDPDEFPRVGRRAYARKRDES